MLLNLYLKCRRADDKKHLICYQDPQRGLLTGEQLVRVVSCPRASLLVCLNPTGCFIPKNKTLASQTLQKQRFDHQTLPIADQTVKLCLHNF